MDSDVVVWKTRSNETKQWSHAINIIMAHTLGHSGGDWEPEMAALKTAFQNKELWDARLTAYERKHPTPNREQQDRLRDMQHQWDQAESVVQQVESRAWLCGQNVNHWYVYGDLLNQTGRAPPGKQPDFAVLLEPRDSLDLNPKNKLALARRSRDMYGFVLGHMLPRNAPVKTALYIDLICTRSGWGAKLMRSVEQWARQTLKVGRIHLAAVPEVIGFYRGLGYVNSDTSCAEQKKVTALAHDVNLKALKNTEHVVRDTRYRRFLQQLVQSKLTATKGCKGVEECSRDGYTMTKCLTDLRSMSESRPG